ncbi:hypothetical protein EZS27_043091, partial [termite gut metagenome]
ATNLSGFNAFPVGLYEETYIDEINEYKYAVFWSMKDDDSHTVSKSVSLDYNSDQLADGGAESTSGLCIRCLRL